MARIPLKTFLLTTAALGCFAAAEGGMDRSRFNIGAYCLKGPHRTAEMFDDLKACNIDYLIFDFFGDTRTQKLMTLHGMGCVEYNIVPHFFGGNTNIVGKIAQLCPLEEYVRRTKAHKFSEAEWMNNFGDELSAKDFPHIGKAMRLVERISDRPAYLNLHPGWHQAKEPGSFAGDIDRYLGVRDYREYIAAYCRELPLDYISYDNYPYQWLSKRDWAFARYFDNFRIVADACTATGRSFWFVPQVNTIEEVMEITTDKLRYQAFAAMSFGVENLAWACWSPWWWKVNVLDKEGKKTAQYERLKTVNAEIRRIADDYMRFRRVGTHFTGFTGRAAKWLEPDPHNRLPQLNFDEPNGVSTVAFKNIKPEDGKALIVGDFAERSALGGFVETALPMDGGRARSPSAPFRRYAIFLFAAEDPFGENPTERKVRFETGRNVRAIGPNGEVPVERTGELDCVVKVRSSECVFVMTE